jgi:hypothetical protein
LEGEPGGAAIDCTLAELSGDPVSIELLLPHGIEIRIVVAGGESGLLCLKLLQADDVWLCGFKLGKEIGQAPVDGFY